MKKQLTDSLMIAITEALSNVHTATIAKVTAITGSTISCKPVTNRLVDGKSVELPEFITVPVLFMQGGGSYTAHPIAVGDYALLIFTERCFDGWYSGNDFLPPVEYRMHDYSDGVAIVGINPAASGIQIPETIVQVGTMHHTGDYYIVGNLSVTGNITCTERLTAAHATINGIDFENHVHGGVQTGTGTSGGPQ